MKRIMASLLLAGGLLASGGGAFAANHCISPSGSLANGGTSWSDAWPNVPASAVTGDTYVVAGGNYGAALDVTTTGTYSGTPTTIRHALSSDVGTGTTCGAGASSIYSTQAVWGGGSALRSNHMVLDGKSHPSNWDSGGLSGYGFKIDNSGGGSNSHALDIQYVSGGYNYCVNDITVANTDLVGTGTDNKNGDFIIYSNPSDPAVDGCGSNGNGLVITHSALHEAGSAMILLNGNWFNIQVDHNFFGRNHSDDDLVQPIHGEAWSSNRFHDAVVKDNVFADIEGTAIIALINGHHTLDETYNLNFFNNVILWTTAYRTDSQGRVNPHTHGTSAAIFAQYDASPTGQHNCLRNTQFIHNTVFNGDFFGANLAGISNPGDGLTPYDSLETCGPSYNGTSHTINNLFWNSSRENGPGYNGSTAHAPDNKITRDNNYYFDTYESPYPPGGAPYNDNPNDLPCYDGSWGLTGNPDPYGLGSGIAAFCPTPSNPFTSTSDFPNLRLTYAIKIGANLGSLFSGYATDFDGNPRTNGNYHVGAFQ
jgi:hypothetical protein